MGNSFKQKDFVLKAFEKIGPMATLGELYDKTDISKWGTKTPFATIRRILQTNSEFFKIQPGLCGLSSQKNEILKKICIKNTTKIVDNKFTHTYYQGLITEIGILKFAKTVDVIWFNDRKMPNSFFEVEHTTDFKNSINKFFELQDFKANFYVVTKKERKKEFENIVNSSIYLPIKKLLKFAVYESIVKQFEFQKRKFKS
ncbi:hypothetical protein [Campylobacter hominis]|uniref:hypothetical protein n=1 Tax=Campylobacter hominis TaxID=76517 RepID=UPI00248AB5FA|nr:hypothetical protein [Campylobacter hominis]